MRLQASCRTRGILAGLALLASAARAEAQLQVSQAGPLGELRTLVEAAEVRVTFSEPMVALGRIDATPPAFFEIAPAVPGSFRWSGTNVLVFTPRSPLPYATRFEVTLTGAASAAGSRLLRPYSFSFTTPSLKLERAQWYRQNGKSDSPLLLALRFNQPVEPEALRSRLSLRHEPHAWEPPELPRATLARLRALDPQALADYDAKVARARAVAARREPVPYDFARDWDRERFPADERQAVIVTRGAPPPNAWLALSVSGEQLVLKLEPAFFVSGLRCASACDPEGYNPLRFALHVAVKDLRGKLGVHDITEPSREVKVTPALPPREGEEDFVPDYGDGYDYDRSMGISLQDAGYSLAPARLYAISVDKSVRSADGQTLGYTWMGPLENWRRSAYTSFGSGHGVWERGGGPLLPYYARNLREVTEWRLPLPPSELMPAVKALAEKSFELAPAGAGSRRALAPVADQVQSYGLDLRPALGPAGTGLVWVALEDGAAIDKARVPGAGEAKPRAGLVQVTNLGLTVKDSPQGMLILVTRLDDGTAVPGARIEVRDLDNRVVWSGLSDAAGLAHARGVDVRSHERYWQLAYLVTAEKDGDVAYLLSDWNEGVEPWYFGIGYDLGEAKPLLRGTLFADRGVYKLGEEVRLKAVLRSDTATGMRLLDGKSAEVEVRDGQGKSIEKRTLSLSEWSSAELSLRLPEDGVLGRYVVEAAVAGHDRRVTGEFLVAAYRRPSFRVDANLAGESPLAGVSLKGVIESRYLFGAPVAKRPVRWTLSKAPLRSLPEPIVERFPEERFAFLDEEAGEAPARPEPAQAKDAELDAAGKLELELPTELAAGRPYLYTLEGEVADVSRQRLAGRASFRVEAAAFYLGIKRPSLFVDARQGLLTELVAVDLAGRPLADVDVKVTLSQVQWTGVRRAEGSGYYAWETERKEVAAGEWSLRSGEAPQPLRVPLEHGGYFVLRATAGDGQGRTTTSTLGFYALGSGYTAWERYDHNRIDLVPDKKTYRPGETARLLIKSPWEQATALLTTEREGIRSSRSFALQSTQQTVSVELSEADIPNLYVSVVLVKGRSGAFSSDDTSDPGKPAFRVGYAELKVEDASKRLLVELQTDREEYRPGSKARVDVSVMDARGEAAPAEVTLWAVDYGVLSLTAFKAPDVRASVWVEKSLQVMTQDSRQNIVSRRVLASKGGGEGGGGGQDEGPGSVRRDFRPLAFWLGGVATDAQGKATREVTLPESLTTYRIMAVAGDKASRFGRAEREIRTSKPLLLEPAFPRFLTVGDQALFGAVVHSRLAQGGRAIVTLRSLGPELQVVSEALQTVEVAARGSVEARFQVRAKAPGRPRLELTVSLLGERDAFEDVLPVGVSSLPETVAAYGQADPEARQPFEVPRGVLPGYGGLSVEVASTALVGLGEGARYLIDYPYGCAEQRASATLALVLAADLGEAFRIEGLPAEELKRSAQAAVRELEAFQCASGGFSFWKGDCVSRTPYLTAYVLHALRRARSLGYSVSEGTLERGYAELESALGEAPPGNASFLPSYLAWQAYAAKVLAEAGRNADSATTRLLAAADRTPLFGLAYLIDALVARGETGPRLQDLVRRVTNTILTEAGASHVEEPPDPYLAWLWSSSVRSTAAVLRALLPLESEAERLPSLVRFLMQARERGRWGNTQENALVLEALSDYYRKREAQAPDMAALLSLGRRPLGRSELRGRGEKAATHALPMPELLASGAPGERLELLVRREGSGTLLYGARLRYALPPSEQAARDNGIAIERSYAPAAGGEPRASFQAGELVRVSLKLTLTKERRFVAVRDPLPAGLEAVESAFATTASEIAREVREGVSGGSDWTAFWRRGGIDRVERHDDRVQLFATRLGPGEHSFSYLARATTAGSFQAAAARAEEMYTPEIFGTAAGVAIEVRP